MVVPNVEARYTLRFLRSSGENGDIIVHREELGNYFSDVAFD